MSANAKIVVANMLKFLTSVMTIRSVHIVEQRLGAMMPLNPYDTGGYSKPKREYAKLKPKWVPKHEEPKIPKKPLRPMVDTESIKQDVWKWEAKLADQTSIDGYVKGITIASAAFAAGRELMRVYGTNDVDVLTVRHPNATS